MKCNSYKRVFIVDTENTNNLDFINKFKLDQKDKIVLFSSVNSKPINTEFLKKIFDKKICLEIQQVKVGAKNAMDHQIIIYLTLSCNKDINCEYYIVSNDSDYNYPIQYLNELLGSRVSQVESVLNSQKSKEKNSKVKLENQIINEIRILYPNKYKDIYPKIFDIIYNNQCKNDIHNELVKLLGVEGQLVYKRLKSTMGQLRSMCNKK
ncbi:PIN domain-containing protein [Clostridium sp.]|uniref:PIN domain-containing protein n=1 Tax=Clostridium sp. TaxID=1506 RepID=UPI001B70DEEF|nr:PIN domain-containing protein [Clostridium sp.]MBP3915038.1 hypothetical protein [Clostridium sp.]